MKTHELILAIVLALVMGVLIEIGGTLVSFLLVNVFGYGVLHFWMLLHRPIQRLVFLFLPARGRYGFEVFILYRFFSVCAWGTISFAGIWMFHRLYRKPDEEN